MGLLDALKNTVANTIKQTFDGQTLFFKNGQLYKIIGDQENWYDPKYIVSDGKQFDLSSTSSIADIPVPKFGIIDVASGYGTTGMLDYVLRMKSGNCFNRHEKDLCSALLWKSTELMFANKYCNWKQNDFERIIDWHIQMGMTEDAEKARKYLTAYGISSVSPSEFGICEINQLSYQDRYKKYEAEYIRKSIENNNKRFDGLAKSTMSYIFQSAKRYSVDLVRFDDYGSGCCEECAKLSGRVYSISGKSRKFPPLPDYVKKHGNFHPGCRCMMSPYFDDGSINYKGKVVDAGMASNRPFIDDRTSHEKNLYEQYKNNIVKNAKIEAARKWYREEYEKLLKAIPNDAPKSFSAYSRMKNENTTGFQKLKAKAAENGIEI